MLKHIPFFSSLLEKSLNGKKPKHSHVLVYGAIEAHSMGPKGCIASNTTLAKETGFTPDTISNMISELAKGGWIEIIQGVNAKRRSGLMPLGSVTMPSDSGIVPLPNGIHYIETEETGDKLKLENDSKDINALIVYFYEKLTPTVKPLFSQSNRQTFDSLITYARENTKQESLKRNPNEVGLSTGVKEVRDTIDKAEKLLSEKYAGQYKVTSVLAFAQKFKAIQAYSGVKTPVAQPTTNF